CQPASPVVAVNAILSAMNDDLTYHLPAIGKPPEPPMLRKIALEEHFNFAAAQTSSAAVGLDEIVRTMDYDRNWLELVGSRLVEIGEKRLAGMDESGIDVSILSLT